MSSTSETGHAKNVANFEGLISFCKGYGASYNPSKDALLVTNLQTLHNLAKDNLRTAIITKTSFDNATNARKIAFKDLKPLSTKIINALAVSGSSPLTVTNAKTINRKLQGTKANIVPADTATTGEPTLPAVTVKTISTSQQSFDSIIEHFSKLLENVSQDANYKPNEAELQVANLQIRLGSLKTSNTFLINSFTNWSNARITRDNTLYNPITGLTQTALDIKKYVKSVFNSASPQYKQVSGIEFKTIKDN